MKLVSPRCFVAYQGICVWAERGWADGTHAAVSGCQTGFDHVEFDQVDFLENVGIQLAEFQTEWHGFVSCLQTVSMPSGAFRRRCPRRRVARNKGGTFASDISCTDIYAVRGATKDIQYGEVVLLPSVGGLPTDYGQITRDSTGTFVGTMAIVGIIIILYLQVCRHLSLVCHTVLYRNLPVKDAKKAMKWTVAQIQCSLRTADFASSSCCHHRGDIRGFRNLSLDQRKAKFQSARPMSQISGTVYKKKMIAVLRAAIPLMSSVKLRRIAGQTCPWHSGPTRKQYHTWDLGF